MSTEELVFLHRQCHCCTTWMHQTHLLCHLMSDTIEYCSHPFPWMGFRWAWRTRVLDSHRRYGPHSTWQDHQCTGRHACGWSGPHIEAVRSVAAAAGDLPGTCSWCLRTPAHQSSTCVACWKGYYSKRIWKCEKCPSNLLFKTQAMPLLYVISVNNKRAPSRIRNVSIQILVT